MHKLSFLDLNVLHRSIHGPLTEAFNRVLSSGLFIMGSELEAFEAEFATYCGVQNCVGVGNGLEALHLLLRAYAIGPGDEVIVPSNTFIATWLAVTQCGAKPVPVEPNLLTYNIDPELIEGAISARTRAIIPVHLYGQPADMDPINEIAAKYGLIVIEDAAQAQGAKYKNRSIGSLGHSAATSFYPGKNLGALGDGGAILTDDPVIAERVRSLRNYGSVSKYQHEVLGYNSRLDELQAAFLRVKLQRLDEWNDRRRQISKELYIGLESRLSVLPYTPDFADPVWHLFVIRHSERDSLRAHLERLGIQTGIHYPTAAHKQHCYREAQYTGLPIAEKLAKEVLSLPIHPNLTDEDVQYIIEGVRSY